MDGLVTRIAGTPAERAERAERIRIAWSRFSGNALSVVGVMIILSVFLAAIFAPFIAPYPEDAGDATHFEQAAQSPSAAHIMGTDTIGRDVFSRILFGARLSLLMAVTVLSIAITVGVTLGLVAGYLGGPVNAVIMRVTDMFLAIPPTLFALAVTAALGPTLTNAMVAISITWWPWYTRLVQGEVRSIKEEGFVEASEALGAGWLHVAFKEILPNAVAPITVKATIDMSFVILVAAGLGFLGLGANPPTPEWGLMIAQGRANLTSYWWIATFPGLAISFTVLGFNLLGDGLRDVFDVEVESV